MYLTLCPIDGPEAFNPRRARVGGSTMDTVKISDTYLFYSDRGKSVIRWQELGTFVATTRSVMFAVSETSREPYDGVL